MDDPLQLLAAIRIAIQEEARVQIPMTAISQHKFDIPVDNTYVRVGPIEKTAPTCVMPYEG